MISLLRKALSYRTRLRTPLPFPGENVTQLGADEFHLAAAEERMKRESYQSRVQFFGHVEVTITVDSQCSQIRKR